MKYEYRPLQIQAESDLHADLVKLAFAAAWDTPDVSHPSETYLSKLAAKLSMKPTVWLKDGRWQDICHLAFRYLDIDGDGVLGMQVGQAVCHLLSLLAFNSFIMFYHSMSDMLIVMCLRWEDLVKHISEDNASHVASRWVNSWGENKVLSGAQGIRKATLDP